MLAELTISPLPRGQHISSAIAPAISLIETSGLPYQLTPSGTCIEEGWWQDGGQKAPRKK